ncbi:Methyltransferase domain-containing protein [Flexibacter flexilis DSM 6793]|uniref:Methyltransferase domain-containing protein n=1 Tax=Flexibacter flexilis DSM 6793 TaxID=927664 RepID=A0A1I1DH56_9BACT|nr:class I SAM-dependent methyltransferase [Flexibacter flexilis]SFB74164.1 Methyltransferase domain-containing protein [Flexibacter flexilis DSM 6793]
MAENQDFLGEVAANYLHVNRQSWNGRVEAHLQSEFYDVAGFLAHKNSLKSIEQDLLGEVKGKEILHLQCHFGQDTLSLAHLGAVVTGVDLSDKAITAAQELAHQTQLQAEFICADIYELPQHLHQKFDVVFTSYGTIGWLPDLDKWAKVIAHFLKPNGRLVFVEFHAVVWMFDDSFQKVAYNYFNDGAIVETESGTYADRNATITQKYVMWNHPVSDVLNSLIRNGLDINSFDEYDYSPYDCFRETEEFETGKFRIKHLGNKIPMVYAIAATRKA